MNTHDIMKLMPEVLAALQGTGANISLAQDLEDAIEAALQSQDREDVYIPEERSNYTPSITDCDAVIAQREGYTEGWNDCRQDIIDRARRVEGDRE